MIYNILNITLCIKVTVYLVMYFPVFVLVTYVSKSSVNVLKLPDHLHRTLSNGERWKLHSNAICCNTWCSSYCQDLLSCLVSHRYYHRKMYQTFFHTYKMWRNIILSLKDISIYLITKDIIMINDLEYPLQALAINYRPTPLTDV